jgi:hypothetical protein
MVIVISASSSLWRLFVVVSCCVPCGRAIVLGIPELDKQEGRGSRFGIRGLDSAGQKYIPVVC